MGGESIKPIRKRIHVYFLMTAYISFTIATILAYKFSTKNRLTLASIYSIFLIFISFFIQLLSSNEDVVLAIIASLM